MRKDAVAWEQRIESATKKTVKMAGEWKLAHLLQKFTPQTLSVKIYGKEVQVEAVEREVFIRGFQPQVKVVVAKGKKEPIIFGSSGIPVVNTRYSVCSGHTKSFIAMNIECESLKKMLHIKNAIATAL